MRYPIIYQHGTGIEEKNIIKEIMKNIPKLEININLITLESDINDIQKIKNSLITEKILENLLNLKNDLELINSKNSKNLLLIDEINNILNMKMRDIKSIQIERVNQIKIEYMDNYTYLNDRNNIYLQLKLDIENIMKTPIGSQISEMKILSEQFGDFSKFDSESDDSNSDEDDSYDFM